MTILDLKLGRQLVLQSQLLAPGSELSGKEGAQSAIEHLGYVQVDSISVISRAHHHVLWTRVPDYRPEHLQTLLGTDRSVFEYWAHAASYLPMEAYRFSLLRKSKMDEGSGFWRRTDPKLAAHVLDRIRQEGPLMSRDFDKKDKMPGYAWMIPAINQVIRQLFMTGQIMVAGRKGIQKTYDLPERILPPDTDTSMPSHEEHVEWLVRRKLRAQGLLKLREFGYLLRIPRKDWQAALKKMVQSGEVEEVQVKGLGSEPYFTFAKGLKKLEHTRRKKRFHILSPFDNLVIQRRRLQELFGFEYTLECYVPAAKRKFGYFALTLLYGTDFVGKVDLKADRKAKVLMVKNLAWVKPPSAKLKAAFEKKLKAFAKFNGCADLSG